MRIVECVPNFSEGRDPVKIRQITDAIEAVKGVRLLDTDPGYDTNRTVVTFVGDPDSILEGAFAGIRKAAEVIDMREHHGAHARMGATDVCPFIPVSGISHEECVQIAEKLGQRVADELNLPVYLYEKAARSAQRVNLADVRKGEYEGLEEKLRDPVWMPDFGEPVFNARSGALITGVREFLIAYNVNLNTRDKKLASDIALSIREQGRARRDEAGNILHDTDGTALKVPGLLKNCKAVGWYIDEYDCAQVSINLTDYRVTGIHDAFDTVCAEADKRGLRVTGSEIVGLLPKAALLASGAHYLLKQGKSAGLPEKELIRIAVQSMGCAELAPFDAQEKIIDYRVSAGMGPLASMSLSDFADELSMDSPAPGGGSVSALAGSLAASLASMVAQLSIGKKGYEAVRDEMLTLPVRAQSLKDALLKSIDEDTEAFRGIMAAMRLPKKSDEETKRRAGELEKAVKTAAAVPLTVMKLSRQAMELCAETAEKGNRNSLSDSGVGLLQALAAMEGAAMNVLINIKDLSDASTAAGFRKDLQDLLSEARRFSAEQLDRIWQDLVSTN